MRFFAPPSLASFSGSRLFLCTDILTWRFTLGVYNRKQQIEDLTPNGKGARTHRIRGRIERLDRVRFARPPRLQRHFIDHKRH